MCKVHKSITRYWEGYCPLLQALSRIVYFQSFILSLLHWFKVLMAHFLFGLKCVIIGQKKKICLEQGCQTHFHRESHQPRGWLQRAEIILGLYKCNFSLTVKESKFHLALQWVRSWVPNLGHILLEMWHTPFSVSTFLIMTTPAKKENKQANKQLSLLQYVR